MRKHTNKNAPFHRVDGRGGDGYGDTKTPLLLNIEHWTEHDAPLLCIAALPSYLSYGCYIVITVERVIGNPQVRKDFPNG